MSMNTQASINGKLVCCVIRFFMHSSLRTSTNIHLSTETVFHLGIISCTSLFNRIQSTNTILLIMDSWGTTNKYTVHVTVICLVCIHFISLLYHYVSFSFVIHAHILTLIHTHLVHFITLFWINSKRCILSLFIQFERSYVTDTVVLRLTHSTFKQQATADSSTVLPIHQQQFINNNSTTTIQQQQFNNNINSSALIRLEQIAITYRQPSVRNVAYDGKDRWETSRL